MGRRLHSGLIWAVRMTLRHFSVSSAMCACPQEQSAQLGKSCLDLGVGKSSIDLLIELIDDKRSNGVQHIGRLQSCVRPVDAVRMDCWP
jgi:hypothetical protein